MLGDDFVSEKVHNKSTHFNTDLNSNTPRPKQRDYSGGNLLEGFQSVQFIFKSRQRISVDFG